MAQLGLLFNVYLTTIGPPPNERTHVHTSQRVFERSLDLTRLSRQLTEVTTLRNRTHSNWIFLVFLSQ